MKKSKTVKITRAEADSAKPHHDPMAYAEPKKGMKMDKAIDAVVEAIKDPVVVAKKEIERTNRTLLDYREADNPKAKRLRLYIREGIVMNPKTEEAIVKGINDNTLTAVRLRRTREAVRVLERSGE